MRLKEIGSWMKANGEAIYGTRNHTVFGEGNDIRYTASKDGKTTFVFFMEKPVDKVLLRQVAPVKTARVTLLGSSQALKWKAVDGGMEIVIPKNFPGEHVWTMKIVR
jgi:alpha-L-fucosidase